MRFNGLALMVATMAATPAVALVPGSGLSVGVTGGSLGIGPEIGYKINPLIGVRASATFLGFDGHGSVRDYRYSGSAHISNFGGTIDVHPFLNGFRLSAGVRSIHGDRVHFKGVARGDQTYGGVTYTPDEAARLSGNIRARSVAPLATIGYAHTFLPGFYLGIDGGVLFQGHPRVTGLSTTGELATNANAQASLNTQIARLRDRVHDYSYYPVAQISAGYRF